MDGHKSVRKGPYGGRQAGKGRQGGSVSVCLDARVERPEEGKRRRGNCERALAFPYG